MGVYHYPRFNRGILDNPIHIYRRILRQISYLQDDTAREYLPKYVRSRYQENAHQRDKRLVQNISEGRQAARMLEKANMGVFSQLSKVLESAYGRCGKRRHDFTEVR